MSKPPVICTIAGFDPSSGAGISADLKTITSLGGYGIACITALTVQNTMGVLRVDPISPQTIRETLNALLDDFHLNAIKIGMLATEDIAIIVADFLSTPKLSTCPVVLDPILRSSSGTQLLSDEGERVLREQLLPLSTVVTPNRSEAALLTGLPSTDSEAMAQALLQLGAKAAVVTGGDVIPGHIEGKPGFSHDVLAYSIGGMEFIETLSAPRIHSQETHGTGCAFSTAIACGLARGQNVPTAVTSAKAFVSRAIERAPGLGQGKGPMGLEHAGKE
jgi:hydroxymethylpyrimidine/phosphomethylpyrimidine kinase